MAIVLRAVETGRKDISQLKDQRTPQKVWSPLPHHTHSTALALLILQKVRKK